jgi:hypothetical protein
MILDIVKSYSNVRVKGVIRHTIQKFGAQYKEAAECHLRIPALNAMSPSIPIAN